MAGTRPDGVRSGVTEWAARRLDESDLVVRSASTVFARYRQGARRTPKLARDMAAELEAAGIGVEPDARHTPVRRVAEGKLVLFALPGEPAAPRPRYHTARALLQIAASTSRDGAHGATLDTLLGPVAEALGLTDQERARLAAHRRWLAVQRRAPGRLDVRLPSGAAAAMDLSALSKLTTAASLLDGGLSEGARAVHRLLFRDSVDRHDDAPVDVVGRRRARGFAIPSPAPAAPDVRLDPEVVRARLDETAAVEALLTPIFASGDEPQPPAAAGPLDSAHTALLRRLAERDRWSRDDVEMLASEAGLLASGALDTINDAAFEVTGAPAVYDEGELVVESGVAAMLV